MLIINILSSLRLYLYMQLSIPNIFMGVGLLDGRVWYLGLGADGRIILINFILLAHAIILLITLLLTILAGMQEISLLHHDLSHDPMPFQNPICKETY